MIQSPRPPTPTSDERWATGDGRRADEGLLNLNFFFFFKNRTSSEPVEGRKRETELRMRMRTGGRQISPPLDRDIHVIIYLYMYILLVQWK